MKRNIVITILLIVLFGISVDILAQSKGHRKRKSKSHKDTTATVAPVDTAKPVAVTPPPSDDQDTSLNWITANGLTADTGGHNSDMSDFVLDSSRPTDGFYHQTTLRGAKPFPLILPDKNNLKVYKRIWREIDCTDSMNRIFSTPGETLIQLIMDALKNKKIIAYSDDGFTKPMSYEKAMAKFRDSVLVPHYDDQGQLISTTMSLNDFNPDSVTKFELKEDIVFDKIRGRMINEIVSIAPILSKKSGAISFDIHPFYLSFSQCRNLFAAREVIDLQRDIQNMSYDDLFIQRNFKSRITKEANPGDIKIRDKFPDDAAQKKESDRIEREIKNYKKKLWKY